MMDIYLFLMILMLGHWVADFVLQNDKTAINKSEDSNILAQHCLIYATTMFLFFTIGSWGAVPFQPIPGLFLLWMFFSHFGIDFVTARCTKKLWMNNQRHWFFVMVGFDQFLHILTIIWFLKMVGIK